MLAAFTVVALGLSGSVIAAPDAKVEVFDPYEIWLEGERWGVYIKVTNTGDESFPLLFHPDSNSEYQQLYLTTEFGNPSSPQVPSDLLAKPLPRGEQSEWAAIASAGEDHSAIVRPGESFVYGPEAVLETEGLFALPFRRMATYQVHLLIGDGHWVSSETVKRNFIIDNEAWENEVIGEVEGAGASVKLPFRQIAIDGVTWIFKGRARQCILPEGASPRFSTIDNREFVRIEFEGVDEEPVIVSNRFSHPISGSERTVPHLYLWKNLTSRPMGPATKETRAEKASPVMPNEDHERRSEEGVSNDSSTHLRRHFWVWVTVGGLIAAMAVFWARFQSSR